MKHFNMHLGKKKDLILPCTVHKNQFQAFVSTYKGKQNVPGR